MQPSQSFLPTLQMAALGSGDSLFVCYGDSLFVCYGDSLFVCYGDSLFVRRKNTRQVIVKSAVDVHETREGYDVEQPAHDGDGGDGAGRGPTPLDEHPAPQNANNERRGPRDTCRRTSTDRERLNAGHKTLTYAFYFLIIVH